MKSVLLLVVVSSTIVTLQNAEAVSQATRAVDWALVPKTPTTRVLNGEIGQCICDLHADGCDPNCCCDPDCTTITRYVPFGYCRRNTTSWRSFQMCATRNYGTDLAFDETSPSNRDEEVGGTRGICLDYDNFNNRIAQTFVLPTNLGPTDIPSKEYGPDWYVKPEHTNFEAGDRIPLLYADPSTGVAHIRGTGFLTMPSADGRTGLCNNDKVVKYMSPVQAARCRQRGTVAQLCSSNSNNIASTEYYKRLAITAPMHAGGGTDIPIFVQFVDAADGAALGETYDPSNLFKTASARRQDEQSTDAGRRQTTDHSVNTNNISVCSNFVTGASLTVTYSFESKVGRIINASYRVFVTTLSAPSNETILMPQMEFAVFQDELNNNPASLRSGNPGYVAGQPINAGGRACAVAGCSSGKEAVEQRIFGMSLPRGGKCSDRSTRQVRFLHDVLETGCGLELTEKEFVTMCGSASNSLPLLKHFLETPQLAQNILGATNITSSMINRIGRTSDADSTNPTDWVELQGWDVNPTKAEIYKPALRRCTSVITGLKFSFLVGRAGIEYNAQDIILAAKVEPITGTWTFRNDSSTDFGTGVEPTSTFHFKFQVGFSRYVDTMQARRVVPPRWLPEVDEDVFYPFKYPSDRREEN